MVKEEAEEKGGIDKMPMPNFHACLLNPKVTKILGTMTRKTDGKSYKVRVGRKKGQTEGSTQRSFIYPISQWSAAEARRHCKEHGGKFELGGK